MSSLGWIDLVTCEGNVGVDGKSFGHRWLRRKDGSGAERDEIEEVMRLPEQLEEATNYIKMLEKKLERLKEKKEQLMGIERLSKGVSRGMMVELRTPHIEIHDMGSALEVILVSEFDSQFMFYEILRLLQEAGADVVSAKFSVINQTYFHTIHSEVGESTLGSGAARISNRLKTFLHEYSERMAQTNQQY
ncbi:hypothetical protein NE237_001414 [Protea cynaroides]|uniref:Uncharacterized protein n=1 Tax=Protea cynaroides TaxID=273540 RepID=A0A9Q0KT21_9MAGN|nr:hypothetical protein NE237_001414 [Protea cynaroides]